jgi:protoporphyrinogen oxidase
VTQKQSVVIIGGGPAGLTAAWELVKDGGSEQYDVTVLEATREFGGISRTVKHDGNRMDIGGHRFFSKDDRIMDWWKDVLPLQGAPSYDDKKLHREHDMEPGGPDPEIEDKVMLKRHRVSRIYWNRHFLDYPISLSANTLKAMGFKLTMVAGFSYLKSMVHKLPETNLENFYINRFGRKLYSMFFEGYTEKLWGRHPSEISADWGAQRVKGLSIMGVLKNAFQKLLPKKRDNSEVETSLIEEFWYPKLGPGQLWETVESNCEAAGVKVITDANVVEIRQKDGKIASVVYEDSEGNRTEMAADDFISSMPVKDLVNAVDASDQPAPKDMTEIANGLPYRDFVTVGLLVKHLLQLSLVIELSGILNGVDDGIWSPQNDLLLPMRYDRDTLEEKAENKRQLQIAMGLKVDDKAPLFAVVSRLTSQKGLDLVLEALPGLLEQGGQLALLGAGDPVLQEGFLAAAAEHPGKVGVQIADFIQHSTATLITPSLLFSKSSYASSILQSR